MGYSTDLFVDQDINDEFLCPICHDVLENPTVAHPCDHLFCKTCIGAWDETEGCPMDRQMIAGFKKPQRAYMSMLNCLKVHCPFKDNGCKMTLQLENLDEHGKRCEFKELKGLHAGLVSRLGVNWKRWICFMTATICLLTSVIVLDLKFIKSVFQGALTFGHTAVTFFKFLKICGKVFLKMVEILGPAIICILKLVLYVVEVIVGNYYDNENGNTN